MGISNTKNKNKNTLLCKKWNYISRALLETKFHCTERETIPLLYLKFILAESWARLNSFIIDLKLYENMSLFKKDGVTK